VDARFEWQGAASVAVDQRIRTARVRPVEPDGPLMLVHRRDVLAPNAEDRGVPDFRMPRGWCGWTAWSTGPALGVRAA